jgi:formylglycine-generating enzyme required for sulfatase activity
MGSPDSDSDRDSDEQPQHWVTISREFYMGETEVTQGQWTEIMGTQPWEDSDYVEEGDEYPATFVSWEDAEEFCRRLSDREKRSYRLPTEAEWEYACRGGSQTRYSFGDSNSRLSEYGWFDSNAWEIGEKYAHLVKQKKPNLFGLYDMHGNVFEWCSDWYGDYSSDAVVDPVGPSEGTLRVRRGGSCYWEAELTRCAYRSRDDQGNPGRVNAGFRVVMSPFADN